MGLIGAILSFGIAKTSAISMNSFASVKTATEAHNIAQNEVVLIRAKKYTDLAAKKRAPITNTSFESEVILSAESDYSSTIKERTVTVNVYKSNESLPLVSFAVKRYSTKIEANGAPIGTVIAWASSSSPEENGVWLECNGQSCANYPLLVKVLGANKVPDYRGVFLRGLGSVTSSHFGTVVHKSGNLGVLQGDSIRNITGRLGSDQGNHADGSVEPITSSDQSGQFTGAFKLGTMSSWGASYGFNSSLPNWAPEYIEFNASYVVPVANENRPVNKAVRFFIRAA